MKITRNAVCECLRPQRIAFSSELFSGDHDDLSNVTASQHHVKTDLPESYIVQNTTERTKSTASWQVIPNASKTLTVKEGSNVLAIIAGNFYNTNAATHTLRLGLRIDGATPVGGDYTVCGGTAAMRKAVFWMAVFTNLDAGEHTIDAMWYIYEGTETVRYTRLSVVELPTT